MATQEGRELDREAKAHMALAVLLRKDRSPAKRDEVRRILQSKLSTARIVEAIRRIDAEEEPEEDIEVEGPSDEAEPEEERESSRRRVGRVPNPYRLTLPKLKSILKVPRVVSPFFRYLFREFPRIAEFGRVTHIFSPVFLLPILRLEPGIPQYYSESLVAWSNELLSLLAPTLVVGWKHLSKKRYNMLVALDRLCREISATNLRLLNPRDRNLIDKLRTLETLFLTFHYQSDSAEEAVEALGDAMSQEPELSNRADRAQLLANRLLLPEFTIPSLHNLLLGLNMMKLRAAISLKELLANDLGELFETEVHACDPEIESKIQALVDELKGKIGKLHRDWSHLRKLRELLNITELDNPDYPEMIQLYEYSSPTMKPRSFADDRQNIMDFAPNFFRRFESSCSPLLNGTVPIEGKGRIELFSSNAFQNELDRLRLTASKLERSAFGFRSFPYTRYVSIKLEGKGGVSTEIEVIGHLQESATALVSIGKKLERVLSASRGGGEAEPARSPKPVDPSTIQTGRPLHLPQRTASIARGSWLGGRSVEEALNAVASVCFQSALYFHEKAFIESLASERHLHQRMEDHLETVRRIADSSFYDQLLGAVLKPG